MAPSINSSPSAWLFYRRGRPRWVSGCPFLKNMDDPPYTHSCPSVLIVDFDNELGGSAGVIPLDRAASLIKDMSHGSRSIVGRGRAFTTRRIPQLLSNPLQAGPQRTLNTSLSFSIVSGESPAHASLVMWLAYLRASPHGKRKPYGPESLLLEIFQWLALMWWSH